MQNSSRDSKKRGSNTMSHFCHEQELNLKKANRDRIVNVKKIKLEKSLNDIVADQNDLKEKYNLLMSQMIELQERTLIAETRATTMPIPEPVLNDAPVPDLVSASGPSQDSILTLIPEPVSTPVPILAQVPEPVPVSGPSDDPLLILEPVSTPVPILAQVPEPVPVSGPSDDPFLIPEPVSTPVPILAQVPEPVPVSGPSDDPFLIPEPVSTPVPISVQVPEPVPVSNIQTKSSLAPKPVSTRDSLENDDSMDTNPSINKIEITKITRISNNSGSLLLRKSPDVSVEMILIYIFCMICYSLFLIYCFL